jgi:hypothetical protein
MPAYLYKSVRVVLYKSVRVGTANVVLMGEAAPLRSARLPHARPVRTMPEQRCSGGMLGYVLIVVESPEA